MIKKDDLIVVTGVQGQLGYDVVRTLKKRGYTNVLGIDIEDLDLTKKAEIDAFFEKNQAKFIFHNAAFTAVDKAESMPDLVYEINSYAVKNLAETAKKLNAGFMYISTDYVFEGTGKNFYNEDDKKNPVNIYGKSKSLGEDFVVETLENYFILRISWVFGKNGKNFIRTMVNLGEKLDEISVVDDQIGSPTYTLDLADRMIDFMESDKYGIYHVTNEGLCSWYEFAKYIFEVVGNKKIVVKPISTKDYQAKYPQAYRPLNSRLSKKKLTLAGFLPLRPRKEAVKYYIENEMED